MNKIKLYCLPFAGSSANYYMKWRPFLNSNIELFPLELPGRGKRFNERAYTNIEDVTKDLMCSITQDIGKYPVAFYGHSMGSLLSYELCTKMQNLYGIYPVHVFLSGSNPPEVQRKSSIHTLEDKEFIMEINKLGGIPKEIIEQKEYFDIFVPIIKADYTVLETYVPSKIIHKLNCDITILNGKDDIWVNKDVDAWKKFSTGDVIDYMYEGDHFFINNNMMDIIDIINKTLSR